MLNHQLMREHQRIALALEQLERLLASIETVDMAEILEMRWSFVRQVLTHLDSEDALVYAPLLASACRDTARVAAEVRNERDRLAEDFAEHARRDWTDATIRADRSGYAASLRPNLAAVRRLTRREEETLYPLLDAAYRPDAAPVPGRWTAQAWRYRSSAPFSRWNP